jgi:hypothetical protein
VFVLVSLLTATPAQAQHDHTMAMAPGSQRYELGAMAIGALTSAAPALLGRRYTEGYLTQPNVMGAATLWRGRLGVVRATGTVNFEGYTLRRGELNAGIYGEGYVDRRHPHTLLHEAMLSVATAADRAWQLSVMAGKGFTPYGTDDPMMRPLEKYPVNHHHAQIIERVLVGGAARVSRGARWLSLEQAWFNGDEPVNPFTGPQWSRVGDSHATRFTVSPAVGLEAQVSRAFVRSPGITQGGAFDHRQLSTSLRWAPASAQHYGLVEFARTDEGLGNQRAFRFESVLAEGRTTWRGVSMAARLERTERPESERLLDLFRTQSGHIDFQIVGITRWTVGTVQLASTGWRASRGVWRGMQLAPFVELSRASAVARRRPAVFEPATFYGASRQWSVTAGARVHVGTMRARMGRYGVLDPSGVSPSPMSHQ